MYQNAISASVPSLFIASSAFCAQDFLTPMELDLTSTMLRVFFGAAPKLRHVAAVSAFPSFLASLLDDSVWPPDFLNRLTFVSEGARVALTLEDVEGSESLSLEVDDSASAASDDLRDLNDIGLEVVDADIVVGCLIYATDN